MDSVRVAHTQATNSSDPGCPWAAARSWPGCERQPSLLPQELDARSSAGIQVKGTDYQDQLEEISYRIRALDPDVMSDEQFDEQVRRLRAERDRLKALPAEPDRWDEQLTAELYSDIYQALPASERGAWLTSHEFVVHATKKQVSVIQGDVRGTAHLG